MSLFQRSSSRCAMFAASLLLSGQVVLSQNTAAADYEPVAATNNCQDLPHADHPSARISDGRLNAVIFLPDTERGYYRGSRFDWAGVVGCLSLNGHTFFGEWFDHYDPFVNDAVAGPVEEFRSGTTELGYDDAAPGGVFVKIGVGLVRRIDNSPYSFGGAYPIVDHGKWSVKVGKRSIAFTQELHTPLGYAYIYKKVLSLDKNGNVLTLEHHLENIGVKTIDTAVYDHDFFMLDKKQTGPEMEIRLPFVPSTEAALPSTAHVEGKTIRFTEPLQPHPGVGTYITGFSNDVADYRIIFEDKASKVSVEQTADSPISKFYLWATPKTVCPEAYIAIHLAPGESKQWTLHYRFFTE